MPQAPITQPQVSYTVTATLPDQGTKAAYIAWLSSGHLDQVKAGGATAAELIQIDEPAAPIEVVTHYVFPSREAFDVYLRAHAPGLRAEGLMQFGPQTGVVFRRQIGTILL